MEATGRAGTRPATMTIGGESIYRRKWHGRRCL